MLQELGKNVNNVMESENKNKEMREKNAERGHESFHLIPLSGKINN